MASGVIRIVVSPHPMLVAAPTNRRMRCCSFTPVSRQTFTQTVRRTPSAARCAPTVVCKASTASSGQQQGQTQPVHRPNIRWLSAVLAPIATLWALPSEAMEMAEEVMAATSEDLDTSSIVLLLMIVVAVRLAIQSALKEEEDDSPSQNQQSDNNWQDMTRVNVRSVVDPQQQQQQQQPAGSSSRPIMSMYDMEKSAMAAAAARSVAGSVREARRQVAALKIEQKLRPGLMNEGRQLTGYPGAEYLAMMMDGYLITTKSSLSRQLLVQQLSDQALGQCVLRMVAEIAALDQVNYLMQAAHKTEKHTQGWVRSAV